MKMKSIAPRVWSKYFHYDNDQDPNIAIPSFVKSEFTHLMLDIAYVLGLHQNTPYMIH